MEKVLRKRVISYGPLYQVRWKGYGADGNTWEPLAHFDDGSLPLVDAFERKLGVKLLVKPNRHKWHITEESNDTKGKGKGRAKTAKRPAVTASPTLPPFLVSSQIGKTGTPLW